MTARYPEVQQEGCLCQDRQAVNATYVSLLSALPRSCAFTTHCLGMCDLTNLLNAFEPAYNCSQLSAVSYNSSFDRRSDISRTSHLSPKNTTASCLRSHILICQYVVTCSLTLLSRSEIRHIKAVKTSANLPQISTMSSNMSGECAPYLRKILYPPYQLPHLPSFSNSEHILLYVDYDRLEAPQTLRR